MSYATRGGPPGGLPGPVTGPADPEATPLKRVVGFPLLLVFIVGDILGAGVYALSGKVAAEIGGALWLPFLMAFLLAGLTAASYAELVTKYPRAAGAALYTQQAFKQPLLTFLVAFAVVLSGITSAAAAARAVGGDYLSVFVELPVPLVGIVFLLVVLAVNLWGVKESLRVNLVLTAIELTGLLVILTIGGVAVLSGEGDPSRLTEISATSIFAIFGATALAFYALIGFEDSVNLAEEAKDPKRAFPKALFTGLGITGVVYLLVALVASLMVASQELADSDGPLLLVVQASGVNFPPRLFAVIALVAVANTALINLIMASRLIYGMARQRVLPPQLGKVWARRGTPAIAAIAVTVLCALLVLTGELDGLASTTVLFLLVVFTVVNIACLVCRRDPTPEGAFRAPTFIPVLGAVASLVFASPLADRESSVYVRAGILLLVGLALWAVERAVSGGREVLDLDQLSDDQADPEPASRSAGGARSGDQAGPGSQGPTDADGPPDGGAAGR